MANILEFLRVLLSDGEQQRRFVADPHGYLEAHQFGHLSGEDVTEAIPVLMRSLAAPLTERLALYTSDEDDAVPPVRPLVGESDLDAAVRQLMFATSLTGPVVTPPPTAAEEAGVEPPEAETVPAVPGGPSERATPEPVMAVDAAGRIDPFAAFGDELAAIVRFATQQMEGLTRKASERHDAVVGAAEREADAILNAARASAESLRSTAQAEADAILQAATSAREEARLYRQAAKDEADSEAQQRATELMKRAEDEASAILAEARVRRDEILEAERQLRKRLQGVESIFRKLHEGSTVPDDDDRAVPRP